MKKVGHLLPKIIDWLTHLIQQTFFIAENSQTLHSKVSNSNILNSCQNSPIKITIIFHHRYIAVRHSPSTHISTTQTSVYIASAPTKDFFAGAVVKDKKWENLPESFQELRLDKMDGKNLLNKLELLMAALSNSGSTWKIRNENKSFNCSFK